MFFWSVGPNRKGPVVVAVHAKACRERSWRPRNRDRLYGRRLRCRELCFGMDGCLTGVQQQSSRTMHLPNKSCEHGMPEGQEPALTHDFRRNDASDIRQHIQHLLIG